MNRWKRDVNAIYDAIERLLSRKREIPPLIGIDGRCGSGKSTLAGRLADEFDGVVLHMDDFYMPFEKRPSDWRTVPCANMDLNRFKHEVLDAVKAGGTVRYRRFNCPENRFEPAVALNPKKLWIAEGSYSFHPSLAPLYDFKIWLTCAPSVQSARLQKREGPHYASFESTWIPLEQAYAARWNIPARADAILSTDLW